MDILPSHSWFAVDTLLKPREEINENIGLFERSMIEAIRASRELELLQMIPGFGVILAVVILLEVRDIGTVPDGSRLAS